MNVVFVVGCARSGTSILGELIGSHPGVRYIFEAHSIWEWGGTGINDSHRLTAEYATPGVRKRIRHWFEDQARGSSVLAEKNPRNILRVPYIRKIFPEAKIIHIVRDGRDVACSMIPGCGGEQWLHLKPPSWKEYFANYSGALRCAMAWKEVLEIGLEDLEGVSHLQIRYEDLLASRATIADSIFSYIGLDLHPAVLQFYEKIANETASPYHAKHQDYWYRNNHPVRIGRWRENLTEEEQKEINAMLSPLLARLGYPPD